MPIVKIPEYGYSAIPLSPDDHLQIEHLSYSANMNMVIEGTAINDKGILIPFRYKYKSQASLTRILFQFQLGYAALVSLTVYTVELVIPAGDCYVLITLVKAISESVYPKRQILCNGYIESNVPLSFSNSYVQPNLNDQSFIQQIIVTNPAAGAQWTYPVPDFTRLTIISIRQTVTTDANVANRYFHLVIDTAATLPFYINTNVTITASLTRLAMYSDQSLDRLASGIAAISIPMAPQTLEPGFTISSFISTIQPGDQISDIAIIAKRTTIPI